jgi:regulator of sigma E protease
MSGDIAKLSWVALISLTATLSVSIGLVNLFPIPLLDGGHLLYYAVEAVRGRPLGERAQEYGFRFALAEGLSLFVFATWNDLVYLRVVPFLSNLFS